MVSRARNPHASMRRRVIGIFRQERRWLGIDTIRAIDGRIRTDSAIATYYEVLAAMIERGEILFTYDHDGGFWRVLWVREQSTARAACARAELEAIREGGHT